MHEEGPSCSGAVACPVCHSDGLVERNGVVLCPAGDVRLDLRHEGLTLDHVRCAGALTWPSSLHFIQSIQTGLAHA